MNQLTFQTGSFAGETIRTTSDGYASIYDVMRVAGVGRTSTLAWDELKSRFFQFENTSDTSNSRPLVKSFKFPGRGQRDTPVVSGQGLVRLLFLLPGKRARQFVAESAELLVRHIGGDESLTDDTVSETESVLEVAMVGNGFETNRAGDLVYCMEWAKREAERKRTVIRQAAHPVKGCVFGIADLLNVFGNYKNRKLAADQWIKLKQRHPRLQGGGAESGTFYVISQFQGKPMDHCTIPDFFDNVLPHITGPVADAIKRARSTTATLVSTGSQMAVDQTRANAISVMNAGADVQMAVEDIRERVEQSAIDDGTVPVEVMSSRGLAVAGEGPPKYKVIYKDVPPGPKLYRRVSQQRYDPAIDVPPSSKLQPGEVKIGINRTNLNQRNSGYADDQGMFDRLITTRSDREVEQMERVVKGAIHPYTTQNSSEYFNPERLLQSKKLDYGECDPTDRAWKYCYDALMMTEMNSINGVYDAEVIFDDTSEQTRKNDDIQQKRLDDYFTSGGEINRNGGVQSQDRPARTITVRFKRIDGYEKEVVMRENSQNLDMRRMELEIKADYEIEKYRIQTDAELELKKMALEMFKNDTKTLVDFWKVMTNS